MTEDEIYAWFADEDNDPLYANSTKWKAENNIVDGEVEALLRFNQIRTDPTSGTLLVGADHDIIYGPTLNQLDLTKIDVKWLNEIRHCGWHFDADGYFASHV